MRDVQRTPASPERADEVEERADTENHRSGADAGGRTGGVDTANLPGVNPDEQPGIPDEPMSPAEGGD